MMYHACSWCSLPRFLDSVQWPNWLSVQRCRFPANPCYVVHQIIFMSLLFLLCKHVRVEAHVLIMCNKSLPVSCTMRSSIIQLPGVYIHVHDCINMCVCGGGGGGALRLCPDISLYMCATSLIVIVIVIVIRAEVRGYVFNKCNKNR